MRSQAAIDEVEDPVLGDPRPRVGPRLPGAGDPEPGVGNFDDERLPTGSGAAS
jgi:hypothetical protein